MDMLDMLDMLDLLVRSMCVMIREWGMGRERGEFEGGLLPFLV